MITLLPRSRRTMGRDPLPLHPQPDARPPVSAPFLPHQTRRAVYDPALLSAPGHWFKLTFPTWPLSEYTETARILQAVDSSDMRLSYYISHN
jgi:hypothetical protein